MRAVVSRRCGKCGRRIAVGAPLQLIKLAALTSLKIRCADCGHGEIPHDLPAYTPGLPSPQIAAALTRLRELGGLLPFAEREPGEDV